MLWLKHILENSNFSIFNLEDEGCPSLISLYDQYKYSQDLYNCIYHDPVCALKNVLCLNKWCINNNFFKQLCSCLIFKSSIPHQSNDNLHKLLATAVRYHFIFICICMKNYIVSCEFFI